MHWMCSLTHTLAQMVLSGPVYNAYFHFSVKRGWYTYIYMKILNSSKSTSPSPSLFCLLMATPIASLDVFPLEYHTVSAAKWQAWCQPVSCHCAVCVRRSRWKNADDALATSHPYGFQAHGGMHHHTFNDDAYLSLWSSLPLPRQAGEGVPSGRTSSHFSRIPISIWQQASMAKIEESRHYKTPCVRQTHRDLELPSLDAVVVPLERNPNSFITPSLIFRHFSTKLFDETVRRVIRANLLTQKTIVPRPGFGCKGGK